MSLFVGVPVEAERLRSVGPIRNDGLGAAAFQPSPQFCAVVSLVAEKLLGRFGATDKTLGRRAIVRLAAAQEDGKKTAPSIRDCVDLRIAPAS